MQKSEDSRARDSGFDTGSATYHTFVSHAADARRTFVSYWQKYLHLVRANCLGGLSLLRNSVVRLTDCPDMTIAVYSEHKTTSEASDQSVKLCSILDRAPYVPVDYSGCMHSIYEQQRLCSDCALHSLI